MTIYKQNRPNEPKRKVRVIDSDRDFKKRLQMHQEKEERDRVERERMRRRYHPEEFEEEETSEEEESGEGAALSEEGEAQEFVPGLAAEMLDPSDLSAYRDEEPVEEVTAEDLLQQAEAAIVEANLQAEKILNAARAEADAVREAAEQQGYQDGTARAEQEMQEALDQKMAELAAEEQRLQEEHQAALEALEPQMLDTMLEVFERVFHIQFDDKKEILSYLVTQTIMNIEGSKEFRIKASADNFPYLSAHIGEIQAQVGEEYHLEVVADNTLGENRCTIETDAGYFDCSLGVHLESLIKDLKSICLTGA